MSQERYQVLLDLFDRKRSLEKGMDSFDIVMRIETTIYQFLEDIFDPYKVTKPSPDSRMTPDGIIKMGENLILFEITTGKLDRFRAPHILKLIEYAENQVLPLTYARQMYTVLVICREYSEAGVQALGEHISRMTRKPNGVPILIPTVLVKLHEMCNRDYKVKSFALTRIMEEIGPVSISDLEQAFSEATRRKEPLLEAPTSPLRATLEYGQAKAQFEGSFDDVWRSLNRFLFEVRPSHMETAVSRLVLKENIGPLVESLEGILKIAKEGPYLVIAKEILNAREMLGIFLLGAFVGFRLGLTGRDSLSVDELEMFTGLRKSVIQVRLAEMARERLVEIADTGSRRMTTIGVEYYQDKVLPGLRARLEAED